MGTCFICTKPVPVNHGVCSKECSQKLTLRAKRALRNARDGGLIDADEYYNSMLKLNLATTE